MTPPAASRADTPRANDYALSLGLAAMLVFFLFTGMVSYLNTRTLSRNADSVAKTYDAITTLEDVLRIVTDAETGQRGYVLTGNERYLEPYNAAVARIDVRLAELKTMSQSDEDRPRVEAIDRHVRNKMDELAETVALRRNRGMSAALGVVMTDRGKNEMDAVRLQIDQLEREQHDIRQQRLNESARAYRVSLLSGIAAAALGLFLSLAVGSLLRRAALTRSRQDWLQAGELGLNGAASGGMRIEKLAEALLAFLGQYFGAHAGAFFVRDTLGFRRVATIGVPSGAKVPERFTANDGLLGQVARDGQAIQVDDVPADYLTVGSALGQAPPRHLLIASAKADGAVNAVFELGFLNPVSPLALELLTRVVEPIGLAVRAANYRAELQDFLEETQRQSEELQAQSEELKVSNEELEEQSRALKESQARLEQQQAELEQSNAQLEEQAQALESQRDDLSRANDEVQRKADELQQASQYKSDFLANMSHELRTPLNSSLILAKLLADNPGNNLSDEQVKYAQTIQSSGNDLLALINDILDLSKIEAGHMEVNAATVPLKRLTADLRRVFEPLAKQKNLTLEVTLAEGCPDTVTTDRQRLEQILRNLLSNAVKFTERGGVALAIACTPEGVRFAVKDTGIGIEPAQQQAVFDAFRQADGTISRKYGGTGLGLSISRELARLLGGTLALDSTPGKGSTFTLHLPERYDTTLVRARAPVAVPEMPAAPTQTQAAATIPVARVADDREELSGDKRLMLVVEDDATFARVLYDLANELGFQCLIATSAEEALLLARQYVPHAVVLDIGLPDHSGLSVLDRLKRDARTRHVPVHIVSAGDYAQTALALGAVSYLLKPVKRDALADALKAMETKFATRLRRVLIVEDDATQRESVRKLLGSRAVETVAVGTVKDALARLEKDTYDCMVLDLSLPDASGYELLETLSREENYAFPPVIVYTGRDLTADEEQRLRRYSKSIIIKGAKSPERLLDEVTLFLHQVVSELPAKQRKMLEKARSREAMLENRRVLVVEDDVRNVYALTSILEPHGVVVSIARNGREAIEALEKAKTDKETIDLVLMDVMMPEMDGLTATRTIRTKPEWKKLPIIMLTAKAMKDDQERCLDAGANDYMAKPLDVEKLLSLVRVWMPQ